MINFNANIDNLSKAQAGLSELIFALSFTLHRCFLQKITINIFTMYVPD
jgi:hypothetical protein